MSSNVVKSYFIVTWLPQRDFSVLHITSISAPSPYLSSPYHVWSWRRYCRHDAARPSMFSTTTLSSSSSSGRCLSVTAVCVDTHSVCLPTYICVTHPLCTSLCDGPSHTDPRSSILFLIAFRNCQKQVLEYSFRRFHTPHLHYISYCVLFCSSSCYCSCSVLVLWFDLLKIDFLDVPRVRLRSSILLCSTTVLRYTTILPANKQIRPRHRDGFLPRT